MKFNMWPLTWVLRLVASEMPSESTVHIDTLSVGCLNSASPAGNIEAAVNASGAKQEPRPLSQRLQGP